MTIDWTRLIRVRERHKLGALEAVALERETAALRDSEARRAREAFEHQAAAQAELWRSTTSQPDGLSVDSLRRTSRWSRALDTQIAQAGQAARQAQERAEQQLLRLEESRRHLRAAVGDLDKAERLQREMRAAQRRDAEERLQDAAEEIGVQAWSARKV